MCVIFGYFMTFKKLFSVFLLATFLVPHVAFAQAVSLDQMFANFGTASVALMNLVRWSALPIGLFISGLALIKVKEWNESNGRVPLKTPLILAAVGAALISFPLTTSIVTETMSLGVTTGASLSRVPPTGGAPGVAEAMKGILLFIKLVGHLSFLKGFLLLKGMAEGAQGMTIGRALTHIIAGAAAINIDSAAEAVANSVGLNLF